MIADIVIKNGNCLSMNDKQNYKWLAIKDGIIIGIGKDANQEFTNYVDNKTVVIDALENTVLPGFIDSHFHVVQTALNATSIDLSDVKTHRELGEKIQLAASNKNIKSIRGIRITVEQFEEKTFPTRAILDKYCSDMPVWLNSSEYQVSVLNTYAMLFYKIPFTANGIQLNDKAMPTGIFCKKDNAVLRANILKTYNNKDRKKAVSEIMERLINNGITTLNAMEGGFMYSDKDADFVHEYVESFPVEMALFYQSMDIDKIKSMGLKRLGGSFYIDGSFGARTSAISFEYADKKGKSGTLFFSQDEIDEFIYRCYKENMQVALYTIGDRAIELALNAHEKAIERTGKKGLRHRLEHVELPNIDQIKRAKKMGIIFSMQPAYELYWGGEGKMYQKRLGKNYKKTNPFRTIIDEGVLICGGTDCDVTKPNPMLGIHGAVNHPVKEHRIELYEALRMFTYNSAYAIFEEDRLGTLEIGKQADVIILDRDLNITDSLNIKDVKVKVTIKYGEILHNDLLY